MTGGRGLFGLHLWLGTMTGVVLLAIAALPLAVFVVCALARLRILHGATPRLAWRRSVTEVGLVYGTVPWVWLTMLPGGPAGPGAVSLVPLRDLATMPTYQVAGNLLVLAAIGLLGPLRFRALATLPRVVAVSALASTLIEVTQYALALGRVASVDDVLLNTSGAALAGLLSRPLWRGRAAFRAA